MALQQADTAQVLALNIDGKGVHAVVRQGDKTYYRLFNVSTGKPDLDSRFPTDTTAFLGNKSNQRHENSKKWFNFGTTWSNTALKLVKLSQSFDLNSSFLTSRCQC